jgi:hypothetical protein
VCLCQIRVQLDRAANLLNRQRVVPRLAGNRPKKMPCFGAFRFFGENLPIDRSRVVKAAGMMVT